AALPELDAAAIRSLGEDLIASSRPGDEARSVSRENQVSIPTPADELITASLTRQGLPAGAGTVRRIRRAMALPVHDRMKPLPGAVELLAEVHALGMRNVVASNTYWRDADSYWEDFRLLGMAAHIDEIITSVDAGHLKPHPAVFEMAMRWAEAPADSCGVIGNREENDIDPALALGTWTVLIDGKPELSCLLLPVQLEGRAITTVEGMSHGPELHPLQVAFGELGAAQCGYCTPGILLSAKSLLEANPRPTRDEIRDA